MTRKRTSTSRVASSRVANDFKIIRGIGPLYEKHLHAASIRTFAQLAKLSPEDIATHIPNLSASHIRKQGWILQARKLASKKTGSKPRRKKTAVSTTSQHYENFTFEFLLNEKNALRRVRVMHVQSGDVETWANWSPEEIIHFLTRHTKARLVQYTTTPKTEVQKTVKIPTALRQEGSPRPEKVADTSIATIETAIQPPPQIIVPPKPQPILPPVANQIHLIKWTNSPSNSNQPVNSLPHDKNFNMKLVLDLTEASLSDCTQFTMIGRIFAKKMGEKTRQLIGQTQNSITYAPAVDLTIDDVSLTPGLYRLEALINLRAIGSSSLESIDATFQGGLIQIY